MDSQIVVGMDVGSSSVKVAVAHYNKRRMREIIAVGIAPTEGIRKGVVVNIEATIRSIEQAVSQAEHMVSTEVRSVVASIGGLHIEGLNSRGVAAVASREREVSSRDVRRVVDAAKAVSIPTDREMLHVLPRVYSLDGQRLLADPIHMMGVRLEAEVHLITASLMVGHSMVQSINRAGFHVQEVVYGSYAASRTVLSEEEKQLGVLLATIGADTTEILLFRDGAPYFTAVLPIGGRHVTTDIASIMRISLDDAERMKINHGVAYQRLIDREEEILVNGVGSRPPKTCTTSELCEIIDARMTEIFQMVRDAIMRKGISLDISGGIVVSGGGSLLVGITDLAEEILHLPARVGTPANYGGEVDSYQNPSMSTAVGLTFFADPEGVLKTATTEGKTSSRLKQWVRNFFE